MGEVGDSGRALARVLIANRGEIAVRLIESCTRLSITTVAIYTEEDVDALHVKRASEAFPLREKGSKGYLDSEAIIEICKRANVQGVLPGYGFLSENSSFAEVLDKEGILFIGPSREHLEEFGLKHRARELAIKANVPVVPGTGMMEQLEDALEAASSLGYPIMVKATAGGGGMGLQVCRNAEELSTAFSIVKSRGETLFKNSGLFLEKYVDNARHIEAQIFGNGLGDILWLGERECSIQRRHQKVLEESPSPFILRNPSLRGQLREAAVSLAQSVSYKSAGTVEFLVDDDSGEFYFLEMNTRLQVEHGVSELCYQLDLVELMLHQAQCEFSGIGGISRDELLSYQRDTPIGHAIEVRVYAENPAKDFIPSPGLLQNVAFPSGDGIRIDTWVETGTYVSPSFDPLLAKVIVHAEDRPAALALLTQTLSQTMIQGPPTNLDFLVQISKDQDFKAGNTLTSMLDKSFTYAAHAMEILDGGAYTTVQDWPGRIGYLHGVPKSGPMDEISFRIANLLVGNEEGMEGLEITFIGPKMKFHSEAVIALCGAEFDFKINSQQVAMWTQHVVKAGSEVSIGTATGNGLRGYLAVLGGFPSVAVYLGSKSTCPSLSWGGHQGRVLKVGDFLSLSPVDYIPESRPLPSSLIPLFEASPTMYCVTGPYDDEAFITTAGKMAMCDRPWKVGFNSNRGGIRLEGAPPEWNRLSGGEGGSHPSNMVGYGYPIGGVSFTGDQGVIFPVDGGDMSGFICTHVVLESEMWKLGQVKPGNNIYFSYCTWEEAILQEAKVNSYIKQIASFIQGKDTGAMISPAWTGKSRFQNYPGTLFVKAEESKAKPQITLRQAGEKGILFEFGHQKFHLNIQARVQQLRQRLKDDPVKGIDGVSNPGQTSLLITFQPEVVDQATAAKVLLELERGLPDPTAAKIPSRIFHLPFVFDAEELREATLRYMQSVRPYAVYLPDNIEFLRRVNGLKTGEDVLEAVCSTPYLVIGVGWLMGLPGLRNSDPRKRLRAPKANPSRTYTPGGALGSAGDSVVIYPLDSPGGFMLWGLTIPGLPWDMFGRKHLYSPEKPWLFEDMDQIVFHPVERTEFDEAVKSFKAGRYHFTIEQSFFDMAEHNAFVERVADEVAEFQRVQDACERAEMEKEAEYLRQWESEKAAQAEKDAGPEGNSSTAKTVEIEEIHIPIVAPLNSSLWKLCVKSGDIVAPEETVAVLEAMKMEVTVKAPPAHSKDKEKGRFKVVHVLQEEGTVLDPGQVILALEEIEI